MAVVAVIVVGAIAFALAAAVIGREARRLGAQRLQPVYRLPEAVGSVADALDDDAASQLTEHEVSEVIRLHLNLLQFSEDVSGDDEGEADDSDSVVEEGDAVHGVYREARELGLEVTRPHVEQIMTLHIEYLAAIGAVDQAG